MAKLYREDVTVDPDGEFFSVQFDGEDPILITRHILALLVTEGQKALGTMPADAEIIYVPRMRLGPRD